MRTPKKISPFSRLGKIEKGKRLTPRALARRRELMDAWAKHSEGAVGDNVVTLRRLA